MNTIIIATHPIFVCVSWSFDLSLLHQWHTFPLNGVSFPQLLHLIFLNV
ncbi:hypothetical protein [Flavobacterium taihuense]|uniref:Uncharacterized protein n=1 Tax=Flavobacterium taihuense TaxID=2857508 RepID=A0ABS6Y1L3_9FLAO|nr:hypothetical protein [Flavobacterium taihuense]MBW4362820.1 hypothetical protein [Flavobacterium taihuense]